MWVTVVRQGEGAFFPTALQKLGLVSVDSFFVNTVVALQFSSMEREISQDRLLSPNQIREIVMDSDSDNEKYSASEDTEDDEPRHLRSDITDGTYSSRQTGGLLDENGTASHSILWTNDGTC